MFDVARSCLYAHRERARHIDVERMALRSRVHELFVESRSSAGSRSIMGMMREEGTAIGRFKVTRLMEELGLVCKQPGSHAYKQATVERVDIPNHLNREFTVGAPNQVWCGDITYVWAQGTTGHQPLPDATIYLNTPYQFNQELVPAAPEKTYRDARGGLNTTNRLRSRPAANKKARRSVL